MTKNQDTDRSLTLTGLTFPHILLGVMALGMVCISIYLTVHFYEVNFSQDLSKTGAFCDISSFWSCDDAALSPWGRIFNVPISIFGLLFGCFLLWGSLYPSLSTERTNKFLSYFNLFGCLVLLGYSFYAFGHLCLMCTLYYVFSTVVAILFFKFSDQTPRPDFKALALYGAITLVIGGGFSYNIGQEIEKKDQIQEKLFTLFNELPNYGDPSYESPYKLHMATSDFSGAPLRITVFSDFQCPACKHLSDQLHKIIPKYKDSINIQYHFYPLDKSCNQTMKRDLHPYACAAAYLATCAGAENFASVHDEIFEKQEELSMAMLDQLAKKHRVGECYKNKKTRHEVEKSLDLGSKFYKVQGTPTVILNGKKIRFPPLNQLFLLFDQILSSKRP